MAVAAREASKIELTAKIGRWRRNAECAEKTLPNF
jgi:hypothetical protein